ncbi:unnamed protein product [Urochloa humidicola]
MQPSAAALASSMPLNFDSHSNIVGLDYDYDDHVLHAPSLRFTVAHNQIRRRYIRSSGIVSRREDLPLFLSRGSGAVAAVCMDADSLGLNIAPFDVCG